MAKKTSKDNNSRLRFRVKVVVIFVTVVIYTVAMAWFIEKQVRILKHRKEFSKEGLDTVRLTNTSFPVIEDDVKVWVGKMQFLGLEVIVLEPIVLWSTLDPAQQRLLERKGRNVFPVSKKVFTFGMPSSSVILIKQTGILQALNENGFHQYFSVSGVAVQSFNISTQQNQHYFFQSNRTLIHLVIYSERGHFFYIPSIQSLSLFNDVIDRDHLLIGNHPAAFERFVVGAASVQGMRFLAPKPTHLFLAHFASSQFVECNHDVSRQTRLTYPQENNLKTESSLRSFIPIIKEIMNPMVHPFWLASGTLLGWYRECGVIGHTTDHDLATWFRHSNPRNILEQLQKHRELSILYRFGFPDRGFELSVVHKNTKIDIFFTYEETDFFWYAVHDVSNGEYLQLEYSKFTLCSAEMLDHLVLVPCHPEIAIQEEFGRSWMVPHREWNYLSSSMNIGRKFKWLLQDRRRSFREYSQPKTK